MKVETMFSFGESPWERFERELEYGGRVSCVRFLTLLEGENEEAVEDALRVLELQKVTLDIGDLPAPVVSGETAKRLALEEKLVRQGNLPDGLGADDPLRMYLEELASIPACGDVAVLAADAAGGSDSARNMLVNLSLSRVLELAGSHTGKGVLLMDLIQEGSLGLWQSILEWDGSGDFEAHRDWWIRQYMAKCVTLQARENGVGGKLRQAMEDYRSVDEKLLMELGRNPTVEEIAEAMHLSVEQTVQVADMLANARMLNRAKTENETEPEETEDDTRHVEDTAYFQMRQRIGDLLSGLTEQEAKLLTLRFGLEGGLPLDPVQTGAKLGLTADEVVKMEAAALGKLRQSE